MRNRTARYHIYLQQFVWNLNEIRPADNFSRPLKFRDVFIGINCPAEGQMDEGSCFLSLFIRTQHQMKIDLQDPDIPEAQEQRFPQHHPPFSLLLSFQCPSPTVPFTFSDSWILKTHFSSSSSLISPVNFFTSVNIHHVCLLWRTVSSSRRDVWAAALIFSSFWWGV